MNSRPWPSLELGQVLTLQRGYDLPYRVRRDGKIPIVTSSGVGGTHSEAKVDAPGVVTGRYGTIGDVFYIGEDFWPLNTTLYVRDFKGNDPLFISYLLRTIDYHTHSGKSGVPGVNRNDLHKLVVPLPPLAEQRAIAEALSDVDGLLTALDALIAKKRMVKRGAMQRLLSGETRLPGFEGDWMTTSLSETGRFLKGRGITRSDLTSDGVPCVRYGELYTHHHNVIRSFFSHIPRAVAEQSLQLRRGDLLFAGSGETKEDIGKCASFALADEAYAGGDIIVLRPVGHDSTFLGYLLNFGHVREQLTRMGQGDAVVHLYARELSKLTLQLPDMAEQHTIGQVLTDMDAEIDAVERQQNKTHQIKQGMMQELLTGRTRLV